MISNTVIICGAIALFIFLVVFMLIGCYKKAPSNNAYVLSGLKKTPRFLIGTGGFKIPFIERLDKLYLGQLSVDIQTDKSVPTSDFINVNVDAVAKVLHKLRILLKAICVRLLVQCL